jgi:glutamate-ammonia-ligase adenylyltransferase
VEDAQTHKLPDSAEDQALIASSMGMADYASLLAELDVHRGRVGNHFDAVFGAQETDTATPRALWHESEQTDECRAALVTLGFEDAEELAHRLAAFKSAAVIASCRTPRAAASTCWYPSCWRRAP